MTGVSIDTVDDELSVRGDEAGTAPGDRRFRPDVEGLRAVAIVLVVLYHGGLKALSGGYVGVDVFFVISGFVITGLLLRERAGRGRTSFLGFYGRRSRRIIPAATLVIVVTVIATYWVLGAIYGSPTAVDGRWTAVFLANFHFASVGTNYLNQQQPPSPLLNFWSLAVEEQFYLLYPAFFVALAVLGRKATFRVRLGIGLVVVIAASFTLSVLQTNSDPTVAYFSPFTRAWELALGALVAVATPWLLQAPRVLSGAVTWLGLGAIAFSAVAFGADTAYPGSLVAIPVLGAALVIAGGMAAPKWAAESVLGLQPFRWVGRISYSLYLWHWPILIIAADQAGKTSLPFRENVVWLLLALVLSVVTYTLVENPIRHIRASPKKSVVIGLGAVIVTVALLSLAISAESSPLGNYRITPVSTAEALDRQVAAATSITKVPKDLQPKLSQVEYYWGGDYESLSCQASSSESMEKICTLGDTNAKRLMVVYGDSHAIMWLPAFDNIARTAHFRLVVLAKPDCPAELVTIANPAAPDPTPDSACSDWHKWALDWINSHRPSLLVITQALIYSAPSTAAGPAKLFTSQQWGNGLTALLNAVHGPGIRKVFLGDVPAFPEAAPSCASEHLDDVQACFVPASTQIYFREVERSVVTADHTKYVNTTPWFCSATCTPIVGKYYVYLNPVHINALWAVYLQNVLADSIGLPENAATSTLPIRDN